MHRLITLFLFFSTNTLLAQVETITFEEDGLVFIDVKVNNHKEFLSFVFDTGASTTVLDSTVAKRLGIASTYSQSTEGANGSKVYDIATGQTVHVGKMKVTNSNLVLVNLEKLSEKSDRSLDGIIGYDLLSNFVTKFDFKKGEMSFYEKAKDIPDLGQYEITPLRFENTPIPLVDLTYTFKDGSKGSGSFLFDSGANLTVIFNAPFAEQNNLKNRIGKTIKIIARGLTTTQSHILGSVEQLELGGYSFEDLPVAISEAKSGVSGSSQYDGILGAEIINRFDMILDYEKKRFYHKPNDKFNESFVFPRSGMSIALVEGKILVNHIIEGGPADREKIQERDELLSINQYSGKELKVWRKYLEQGQKKVRVKIKSKSSGKIREVVFLLERLI